MGNLVQSKINLDSALDAFFGDQIDTSEIANVKYDLSSTKKALNKRFINSQKEFLHIISQSGNTTSRQETDNGFILRNVDIKKNRITGETYTEINTVQFFHHKDITTVKLRNITIDRLEKHQHVERNSISFDLTKFLKTKRLGSTEVIIDNIKNMFQSLSTGPQLRLE